MVENRQPVQAGNLHYILKLFEPFKQCRVNVPVESYSKVLCGNTTNGKSSLANAVWQQREGVSRVDRMNVYYVVQQGISNSKLPLPLSQEAYVQSNHSSFIYYDI